MWKEKFLYNKYSFNEHIIKPLHKALKVNDNTFKCVLKVTVTSKEALKQESFESKKSDQKPRSRPLHNQEMKTSNNLNEKQNKSTTSLTFMF